MSMTAGWGLYVVFGVLFLPIYLSFGGWLVGEPRDFRTAGIGIAYMAAITVFMIAATVLMAIAFEIIAYIGIG